MPKRNNHTASEDADRQRPNPLEPVQVGQGARFDSPVSIRVDHYRTRLCDYDNLNAKAAIDGIVHCGILSDDGPGQVKEVRHFQHKVSKPEDERTEITIIELKT